MSIVQSNTRLSKSGLSAPYSDVRDALQADRVNKSQPVISRPGEARTERIKTLQWNTTCGKCKTEMPEGSTFRYRKLTFGKPRICHISC